MTLPPGIHEGISSAVYHAMPYPGSSGLKIIAADCPAEFDYQRRNPEDTTRKTAGAESHKFVIGEAFHAAVLEPATWAERIAVVPAECVGRSNAAKEEFEAWQDENATKLQILPREYEDIRGMVDSVWSHEPTRKVMRDGRSEVTVIADDPDTGVRVKVRPDYLREDQRVIVDFKSAAFTHPRKFDRAIEDRGYYFSAAMYIDVVARVTETDPATWQFLIIAVAKTPPHVPLFRRVSDGHLALGIAEYRRALATYAECTASGVWPGYGDRFDDSEVSPWRAKELG